MVAALGKSNAIASSTDAVLQHLSQRLAENNLAPRDLCLAAGVNPATYWRISTGRCQAQRRTLVKLQRALDRIEAGAAAEDPKPTIVAAFWRVAVAWFARELGADPALALDDRGHSCPSDDAWLIGSRARQLASYLTHVELSVSLSGLARALGTSKQRIHKAVNRIEDLRDVLDLDGLLARASAFLSGRQPPASTGTIGKGIVP